jgi:vancomycin resistance protein YoaR
MTRNDEHKQSMTSIASFAVRSKALQLKRAVGNAKSKLPCLVKGAPEDFPFIVAESTSPLRTSYAPSEAPLLVGKIENLRVACPQIHHRILNAGEIFSFWRQVGPPWRMRGFMVGREIREGCMIPTIGGGLCQLSGSLLEVALMLTLEIIERHTHTSLPAGVPHDTRRDATVFWNYVDLRFRSPVPILFESYLSAESLIVRLRSKEPNSHVLPLLHKDANLLQTLNAAPVESCLTCSQTGCVRHNHSATSGPSRPLWRFW